MTHFCTLFDSNYLTRGMALYESLKRHSKDFHLYILAFNDKALEILTTLNLPHTTIISLKDFEDPALLAVKHDRSIAEYSWTCSSSLVLYCLKKYNLDECTYLDADIYFLGSPEDLIQEMGPKSILLTEHRYTPEHDRTELSGRFCVQFMTFKANSEGLTALQWWRERCLEWCYARLEDGKMGDQKYLDDWPTRFSGTHILAHLGGGLAPWNIQQYQITRTEPLQFVETATGKNFKPIFYHFHQVRLYRNGQVDLGSYRLDSSKVKYLYQPYLQELKKWDDILQQKFHMAEASAFSNLKWEWKTPLRKLKRRLKGVYNVYSTQSLLETK